LGDDSSGGPSATDPDASSAEDGGSHQADASVGAGGDATASHDAGQRSGDAKAGSDAPSGPDATTVADATSGPDASEAADSAGERSQGPDGESDASTCPASTPTTCGGMCVDEQTDVDSCGGCGGAFACATGQACVSGQCLGCGTTCPLSRVSTYSCSAGGCNAAGGACTAAGQGCYCTSNSQCKSGACVETTGQNDVSCGAGTRCSGTGASDGFGCTLAAPGIPAACTGPTFGYSPSNFSPGSYASPATPTTINCNTTYSSSTHSFTGWCSGQTAPTIYSSVTQPGGHVVDLLAFEGLTLDAGNTWTLTGTNPVVLAVYGAATISGVIDASAQGGTPGAGASACAVGAAGGGASGASYTAGSGMGASGGGGGGLAVAGGAGGFSMYNGVDGGPTTGTESDGTAGGSAHATSSVVPLTGGCSGGTGAAGTASNAGGAGGGGVQLSAASTISGSGTIKANGSAGGAGASVSPAVMTNDGAGGGGGGSGGDILVESASSTSLRLRAYGGGGGAGGIGYGADTTSANTWAGFPGGNGGTNSGGSTVAPTNGGPPPLRGKSYTGGGGGGGGGYGWTKVNTGAGLVYACTATLSPAPVCNAAHTACLCVADADCSSGKCVNTSGHCLTTMCTGGGAVHRRLPMHDRPLRGMGRLPGRSLQRDGHARRHELHSVMHPLPKGRSFRGSSRSLFLRRGALTCGCPQQAPTGHCSVGADCKVVCVCSFTQSAMPRVIATPYCLSRTGVEAWLSSRRCEGHYGNTSRDALPPRPEGLGFRAGDPMIGAP
jgi:hypothetical protein